jgi:multidrug efflux pump subunit AcrA (membrane-fusion protein)
MEPDDPPIRSVGLWRRPTGPATRQLPLTPHGQRPGPAGARRRRVPWVMCLVVALVAAGVAVVITKPFTSAAAGGPGIADNTDGTGIYTVARQDVSSQTQVPATLGYAGSYTIAAPSGASAQDVTQAQQTVTGDQQALSADEQFESDQASADNQAIAADQTDVSTDRSALSSDRATESQACAGSGVSSPACSQDEQKVSQDQTQLTQAQQQLPSARSTATLDHDQNQAKVQAGQTTLQAAQATLASLQATEVNPGTAYTWLPAVGEIIRQGQPVYSLSDEPVPLLYGSIPAYRAFYVGMSDGGDVGELTHDLIALGYGDGLAQSDHYSAATAAAAQRWQKACGLPVTGEILLGAVVFEPGPIQVTSVTPSVGESVGDGGAGGGGGGGGSDGSGSGGAGGGGTVLSAASTARQVSIALDVGQQSQVAVGDQVTITLPNNDTTPGVVSSVGTVATSSPSGDGSSGSSSSGSNGPESSNPTITVLVNPTDPAATGTWDQAPVNVTITAGTVSNALAVPVAALRAQPGGGYAVEVTGPDGFHHLVAVNLGLFDDADGMVQVTGTSLAVGQQVVVPNL